MELFNLSYITGAVTGSGDQVGGLDGEAYGYATTAMNSGKELSMALLLKHDFNSH